MTARRTPLATFDKAAWAAANSVDYVSRAATRITENLGKFDVATALTQANDLIAKATALSQALAIMQACIGTLDVANDAVADEARKALADALRG